MEFGLTVKILVQSMPIPSNERQGDVGCPGYLGIKNSTILYEDSTKYESRRRIINLIACASIVLGLN